jgi:hypothetical protein
MTVHPLDNFVIQNLHRPLDLAGGAFALAAQRVL